MSHQPFSKRIVKSGDRVELGDGHSIEFISAPNLHWPDTIFSFDHKTQVYFTCDAFGMHYCSDATFDENLEAIEPDFRFYYDCLMGPNSRSLLNAMNKMGEVGKPRIIANGHGPLLYHHLDILTECYRSWSNRQVKAETTVALFYTGGYGHSDRLAISISQGLQKTGVGVEMVDMTTAEIPEVQELVGRAAGIIIGMPSSQDAGAQNAISTILAVAKDKQVIGLYESFGGDDEPIDTLRRKFIDLRLKEAFPRIKIKAAPTAPTFQQCEEAGVDMGQLLTRDRNVKQMKSQDASMEKALGRLSNGLYIITSKKGETSSAMLASWVSQASLQPLGLSIAVGKDRAVEPFMQVGDKFVLNVLEEGNYKELKKQFLKRLLPGTDRFAGVKTKPANNGSPILLDALAYLECEVVETMECNDHVIVYCTVSEGRVSKIDGLTAVRHRKVGNYY